MAGSDERRLEDHTVACGQRRLRSEHEQPVALHRPLKRVQQNSRGGEIPLATTLGSTTGSAARVSSSCCSEITRISYAAAGTGAITLAARSTSRRGVAPLVVIPGDDLHLCPIP